jgi:hypothetical protein
LQTTGVLSSATATVFDARMPYPRKCSQKFRKQEKFIFQQVNMSFYQAFLSGNITGTCIDSLAGKRRIK